MKAKILNPDYNNKICKITLLEYNEVRLESLEYNDYNFDLSEPFNFTEIEIIDLENEIRNLYKIAKTNLTLSTNESRYEYNDAVYKLVCLDIYKDVKNLNIPGN